MSQSEEVTMKMPVPVAIPGPVKYGELIVLGPNEEEDHFKDHFTLCKRLEANGVKPSIHMEGNQSISMGDQHKITFMTAVTTVVLEYTGDKHTDMFQIGRSSESPIDFLVTDTVPMPAGQESRISRFACRITCQRSPPHTAHIYAAGFNSAKNIFLGEKAVKWSAPDGQMDGLTTNGVWVKSPSGPWREISVRGHAFAPREPRWDDNRGERVEGYEFQELVDGSLIDLCGVTLLWRTASQGLRGHAPPGADRQAALMPHLSVGVRVGDPGNTGPNPWWLNQPVW